MGIWTKGGEIDRLAILAKMVRGKIWKGRGLQQPPPPNLRERVNIHHIIDFLSEDNIAFTHENKKK